ALGLVGACAFLALRPHSPFMPTILATGFGFRRFPLLVRDLPPAPESVISAAAFRAGALCRYVVHRVHWPPPPPCAALNLAALARMRSANLSYDSWLVNSDL